MIMDHKQLETLSNKFEKMAQMTSAQPADVEAALRKANLWDKANEVAPLLNQAGVPDTAAVAISIVVGKDLVPSFNAALNPPNKAGAKLSVLLKNKYAAPMKGALVASKLNVESPLTLKWLNY